MACTARGSCTAAMTRSRPPQRGAPLPEPGSTLNRDDNRPYEVTEVRQQTDGQLNVFVREIMKP